jgi:hypothetical protein
MIVNIKGLRGKLGPSIEKLNKRVEIFEERVNLI